MRKENLLPLPETSAEELAPARNVEFLEMPVKQILNRCTNPQMRFRWTINPYRGCEFGCVYCYARYTHEFLEPRDPRPSLRLRALAELREAGIRCHLLMMPMIPGLTDNVAGIEAVIRAARDAGASGLWWRSLFLKPAAARRFIPFIRENFPGDEPRLTAFYGNSVYAPRAYDEHLRAIFDRLKRKYGFDPGLERDERKESEMAAPPASPPEPRRAVQLSLMSGARGGT